jgi:four helix bundle protein
MRYVGSFRDLVVYRQSAALADSVYGAVWRWPPFDRWTVGMRLVRAADSVGANIAEAAGRRTDAEKRRFLIVARGSNLELQHWLDCAHTRGLALPIDARRGATDVGRMLNGLVKATND